MRRLPIRACNPFEDMRRKKIIKIPIDPSDKYALASPSGSRSAKILDPSNGGIGMRLKIANKRFSWMMPARIKDKALRMKSVELGIILKIKLAIIAMRTLVRGPARETNAKSFLPSFKLKGSTGTGLAAPKITGEPESKRIKGRAILIIGSIWFFGLSVKRPIRRAVGSPKRSATYPWAISCKIAEKSKMARVIIADIIIVKNSKIKRQKSKIQVKS